MINLDETVVPHNKLNSIINIEETLPPNGCFDYCISKNCSFLPGESVADSYIISSSFQHKGKQADIYLAKKWGKSYIVKLYHDGWHPSARLQSFLSKVEHPNIANIIESGEHNGQYYEIYEYYSEGTLENEKVVSNVHLQNIIIPSINEGLNELHKNGIVHCDIKPSNLFYAKDQSKVVIGDYGISGYTNHEGKMIDSFRGTPEYAPRVKSLMWSASISPSYDYGSLGLVICRLMMGRSLFNGMSIEEIAIAWDKGLSFPSTIEGRWLTLVKGLLNEDEEQRWGYIQVKRWCEGEFMRNSSRNIYTRPKKETFIKPLIFGRFEGQIISVTSLHQLGNVIKKYWEQARNVVKRRELIEFIKQFDVVMAEKVRSLVSIQDLDSAVFRLLCLIDSDSKNIFYCGNNYDSLSEYIECLEKGNDAIARKFLVSGLLIYYLREHNFDKQQVDKLEQLIKRSGCENMEAITTICFAIQGKQSIDVFGKNVNSLDEFVMAIASHTTSEIAEVIQTNEYRAWMFTMGYEKEMRKMSEL